MTLHPPARPSVRLSGSETLLRMRKLVPLYLLGFGSAGRLQTELLKATTLAQWEAAVATGGGTLYDPEEPFPDAAVRAPRLKGGGPAVRQSMGLPDNWLRAEDDGVEACLSDFVCEG